MQHALIIFLQITACVTPTADNLSSDFIDIMDTFVSHSLWTLLMLCYIAIPNAGAQHQHYQQVGRRSLQTHMLHLSLGLRAGQLSLPTSSSNQGRAGHKSLPMAPLIQHQGGHAGQYNRLDASSALPLQIKRCVFITTVELSCRHMTTPSIVNIVDIEVDMSVLLEVGVFGRAV